MVYGTRAAYMKKYGGGGGGEEGVVSAPPVKQGVLHKRKLAN